MRKISTLLMLFCAFVCTAWAGPTDLPQLSTEGNIKWYTISNTRSTSGKYLYWTENGVKDANVITTASLFYITGESLANCKIHSAATELLFTGAGAWNETGVDCAIEVTPHGEKNAGLAIKFSGTALNEKNFNDEYTTYGANDAGSIFVFSPIAKAPALPELSTEDDIKWYTIKNVRKNKYATYAAEGRMTQQAEVQDASLFYFTGSVENGVATVKIHNGQAGGLLFGNENAWTEEGIDWYIGAVTSTGVAISKTSNFSGNNSWNDFQGGGAEVDYWSATDAGSIWVIEEFGIDVKETIAKLLKAKESPIIGEPKYDEAVYNSLVSAYEQLKAEATVANYGACTAIMAGLQPYMPEVGKFYVIECPIFYDKQGVHKALYSNGEELRWGTFDKANNSFYWTPVATELGLAWKNVNDGKFILGKSDGGQSWTMAETSEGAEFGLKIVASGASQSNYQYAISVTGRHLHANNHSEGAGNESNVVSWETNRANSASAWTLTEYADPTANKPITVKYSFTYGGDEKFSQEVVTLVGEEYPAVNVTFPFGVSAQKPEGTIPADKVVDGVVTETIALTVNLPFEFATDYASITDWYYLKIKGESYLSHVVGQSYIDLSKKAVELNAKDAYTWAFVGNPFDGFKIVNRAAGAEMVLSSTTTITDDANTFPVLTSLPVAEGNNELWMLTASAYQEYGFYIAQKGYAANCMNNRGNKLAYWTGGADNGSTFTVEWRDVTGAKYLQALVDEVEAANYQGSDAPGYYSTASVAVVKEALAAAKEALAGTMTEELSTQHQVAINNAVAGLVINMPASGYYRIKNVFREKYVAANAVGSRVSVAEDKSNVSMIWNLVKNENTYTIQNANFGENGYMSVAGDGEKNNLVESSSAAPYTLVPLGDGQFNLRTGDGDLLVVYSGGGVGVWWGNGKDSDGAWYVEPATDLEVTVGDAGYATLNLPFGVALPNTVKAYAVESVNGSSASLVDKNDIPANTAAILEGAGTHTLTIATASSNWSGNLLVGTNVNTYVEGNAYVLGADGEGAGFFKAKLNKNAEGGEGETHFLNNANKAYLPATAGASLVLRFNFGGTTAIESVVNGINANAAIYDLSGRRVEKATKGIYIVNGKKMIVK